MSNYNGMRRDTAPLFDMDDAKVVSTGCVTFLAILGIVLVFSIGGFLLHAYLDQNVVQPVQRQNLNHDADWLRAKTQEVVNLYHDYQVAQQAEAGDVDQLRRYVRDNGQPSSWPAYDPRTQVYQQMITKYDGDYQAELSDAQQYNADRANPDYAPVWADPGVRAANLPDGLTPGPQPSL